MANDFKAAAERKKRMAQTRRAKDMAGRMGEFLNEKGSLVNEEDRTAVQASIDKLNGIILDPDNMDLNEIISANDEAEDLLHTITEKMNNKPEPEEPVVAEEETPVENVEALAEEPAAEPEEAAAEPKAQAQEANEKQEEGEISAILRKMYAAPRPVNGGDREKKTRFSALIKPSLRKKMDDDVANGKITSANDLINVLLEIYYGDE